MYHISPAEFRQPITIVVPGAGVKKDEDGLPVATSQKEIVTRAKITNKQGAEEFATIATKGDKTAIFYIRYRQGITEQSRIMYGGRKWEIVSVVDIDERRRYLEIRAVDHYGD